jgi:hypothetical protein
MSIEIWQFPSSATKADLIALLKELGFVEGENRFWPGPPGTASLFWAEPKDFISTSGVDASVFPLDDSGKKAWNTSNAWALRTRTAAWATSFDRDFQNKTVRRVRQAFGGAFHNDHCGRNRYIVITPRKSTPASRGVYGVLTRVLTELDNLEYALPPAMAYQLVTPKGIITDENDQTGLLEVTKKFDPARVMLNALVPFLVASIEHFFRESFEILLRYDPPACRKLEDLNRKASLADVVAVSRGELSVEEIVSGWYSFQSIDGIRKAFDEVLGIDIARVLRQRKKVRRRAPMLQTFLAGLIQRRHGVIHHFSLDRGLDRDQFLDLLQATRTVLRSAANEIERKLGTPLGPG